MTDGILNKTIKIVLAFFFFLSLAGMPYGYYELVRFVALIGFALLANQAYKAGDQTEMIIYIGLALLFQPIFKIALGRTLWNVVDVIVAAGLLVSILKAKKVN